MQPDRAGQSPAKNTSSSSLEKMLKGWSLTKKRRSPSDRAEAFGRKEPRAENIRIENEDGSMKLDFSRLERVIELVP
jgi:hypothetical protein